MDFLGRIEPFQRLAPTPQGLFSLCAAFRPGKAAAGARSIFPLLLTPASSASLSKRRAAPLQDRGCASGVGPKLGRRAFHPATPEYNQIPIICKENSLAKLRRKYGADGVDVPDQPRAGGRQKAGVGATGRIGHGRPAFTPRSLKDRRCARRAFKRGGGRSSAFCGRASKCACGLLNKSCRRHLQDEGGLSVCGRS